MKDNKKKVVVGPNFLSSWFFYDFVLCNGRRSWKEPSRRSTAMATTS